MFLRNIKKLMKNKLFLTTIIYLFFSFINQGINLFYTPLLTENLSQAEYGIYSLFCSIEGIISLLLLICIPSGYSRFYNEIEDKKVYENTILNFLILFGLIGLVFIHFISGGISKILFANIENSREYIFLISLSSYATGLISLLSIKYSMEFKAIKASLIIFFQIFIQFMGLIFIFKVNKFTLINVFYIKTLTPIFLFIICFLFNVKSYAFEIRKDYLPNILKFSSGLILGQISTWILMLIDRQFINSYSGLVEVAIYSLANRIGMLINPLFIDPMRKTFTTVKFKVYNKENGKIKILEYYKIYCFLGGVFLLGLSIYSKIAIKILATESYLKATYIIPIIGIAYFFWGLNEFYALGVVIKNKSVLNSLIAFLASLMNIVCNYLLIPIIGMYGAAISSIVSYYITNEVYYRCGKKYYNVDFDRKYFVKFLTMYIFIFGIYIFIEEKIIINIWLEGIMNIFYLIIYVLLSIFLKLINLKEIKELKNEKLY